MPPSGAINLNAHAAMQTAIGIGSYLSQVGGPLPVAASVALAARGRRRSAAGLAMVLAVPGLQTWWSGRSVVDPATAIAGRLADDVAYGAGVWAGCLKQRSVRAFRPVIKSPSFVRRRRSS